MQLHQVKRQKPWSKKKIVGRGGKRGTTSGRGTKGQKARAGHRIRPELRDLIKKLPKKRGYRFSSRSAPVQTVTMESLAKNFVAGETVSPATLLTKGLVSRQTGRQPEVKLLVGRSEVKLPTGLEIKKCLLSAKAREVLGVAGAKVHE